MNAKDRPHRRRRRGDAGHADRHPQARYRVLRVASGEAALPMLNSEDVDLMLLDVRLPGISGFEVLRIVKENYSLVEVIMISAINEIETAVQAMKHGAYHYITKDFDYDQLRSLVRNASERQDLNRQVMTLSAQVADQTEREFIVGPSSMTRDIVDLVHKVAKLSATVLILGESGTGKELLARLIHRGAGDADAPFIAVNLAAIPRELAESTLFGHERGAFTGAHRQQLGKFELASGRHAVPRRDRRPAARPAGQAAARDPGGRDRARRRQQADQDRVPADRRHQRRPREGGQGRAVPRGPVLPDQRHPDQAAAAARAHARTCRSSPSSSCAATTRASARTIRGHHRLDDGDAEVVLVAGQHPRAGEPDRAARGRQRQGVHHRRRPAARVPLRAARARAATRGESLFEDATNTFERNFILRALEKCGWNVTATARYLGIPLSTLKYKMQRLELNDLAKKIRGA